MKKYLLILLLFMALFLDKASSQTSLYFGYENGMKWDRYHYVNNNGFSTVKPTINFMCGGYFGLRLKKYTIETGLYYHYLNQNLYYYDRTTGTLGYRNGSSHSPADDNLIIPLRFGVEFNLAKNHLFIKPEVGLTGIIAVDYSKDQPYSGYYENCKLGTLFIPTNGDSTKAYTYRKSGFNLGYEVSLSTGVRIKNKFDIYLKGSIYNSFKPLTYETITYYSDAGNTTATNTFNGNSITIQIGFRYIFGLPAKK